MSFTALNSSVNVDTQGFSPANLLDSNENSTNLDIKTKPNAEISVDLAKNDTNLAKNNENLAKNSSNSSQTPTKTALVLYKQKNKSNKDSKNLIDKKADIVYHNDFNADIYFPTDFNEVDFNIFYTIFYFLKNRRGEKITLKFEDIKDIIFEDRKEKEHSTLFYKALEKFINKLSQLQIKAKNDTKIFVCNFFVEALIDKEAKMLYLRVNRNFIYILNNLTENYTKFELKKFLAIKGKYNKNIYRLCIQYKNTGKFVQKWDIFKNQMSIPPQYENVVNQKILNPILNFFQTNKGFLNNLKFEKIKEKGEGKRGQGGVIDSICFTWDV